LRLPHDVKYLALQIFNDFMILHLAGLYNMVYNLNGKTNEQKIQEWDRVSSTVSRQIVMRIVSCIQIASKVSSYHQSLCIMKVKRCLQSLGFAYTDEALRKSELRILISINFSVSTRHTPITYIESILDVLFKQNSYLMFETKMLWEHSLLILDCVFLQLAEVYRRILIIIHGGLGVHVSKDRLLRMQADYTLLAAGIIVTACVGVHGAKFATNIPHYLRDITGISAEDIVNAYNGIAQTILAA